MYPLLAYENPGIDLFGFKINAYAIIIVCGIFTAFFVISLLFKRRNLSPDLFLTFFCICLPCALVTTRLFYCITDGVPVQDWFSFEGIRSGGLSIIGGILGGAISIALVCYFKKVNFFRVGDCVVIGLLFAQAIGRWGNFANQEVYGALVENEALQFFPFSVYINKTADGNCLQTFTLTFQKLFGVEQTITGGTWHYAFFFYESIVNTIAGVLLFINAWKNPKKPNGVNTACYFINYGLIRSIMEPLRDPTYILNEGGVQWSFVFSILLLVFGLGMLFAVLFVNKRKEGVLFGSTRGEEYGIVNYVKDMKDEVAYLNKINMMCAIYPENYQNPPEKEGSKLALRWMFKKGNNDSVIEKTPEKDENTESSEEKEKEE
jgi:phosphatidylglycerol:prolipoprotein diacylglycerol transferase